MADLQESIRRKPYEFIRDYYEGVYKHMGKEVFSTLSLVIPSLILPPIPHKNAREIKPSINFLLIAPPGTAKSSMCETFEKLAYNSFPFESITDAKLYSELSKRDFVSLIVGDVFKVFSDKLLNKTMENVLGDEQKLSRFTQRTDANEKKIRAVAFLAGTPNSLTSVISDGIIFRTAVCLVFHNPDEHEKIGEFINDGAFQKKEDSQIEVAIADFFHELLKIQIDQHSSFNPITGYNVKPEFTKRIFQAWKPLVKPMTRKTNFSFFRELHQAYRYMVSHAFLNIYNREVDNGILEIHEEDVDIAIELMQKELSVKFEILSSNKVVSEERLKTSRDLATYVDKLKKHNINLKEDSINIMGSLVS